MKLLCSGRIGEKRLESLNSSTNYDLVELVWQCGSSVHNAEITTLHVPIYFQASAYGKGPFTVFSHCGKWMRFLFKSWGFRSHCPHAPSGSSALQSQSPPASIASYTRIPPRIARNASSHHPDHPRRQLRAMRVSRLEFNFSGLPAALDARDI